MAISSLGGSTVSALVTAYGASSGGGTVATSTTVDVASVTFTTTATNTVWLVEVDADITAIEGNGPGYRLQVKVDGAAGAPIPAVYTNTAATAVGYYPTGLTIRGRLVVALASSGSHTLVGQVRNTSAVASGTYGILTITATQLSG